MLAFAKPSRNAFPYSDCSPDSGRTRPTISISRGGLKAAFNKSVNAVKALIKEILKLKKRAAKDALSRKVSAQKSVVTNKSSLKRVLNQKSVAQKK